MRAKKKKSRKSGENELASTAKKVYNAKHRLIRPHIRYRRNSMFKVATNIGTGTVDYWLWIMTIYGLHLDSK